MCNTAIRAQIRKAGVYQYQVADQLGVSEVTFIRWLRKPLPEGMLSRVQVAIEAARREAYPDATTDAHPA